MSQLAAGKIYQRHVPVRDDDYRRFVKRLPCAACLKTWNIDPCHTGPHGISQKSCDLSMIPLCRTCHQDYDAAPQRFAARHKLDIPALVAKLNAFYREKIQRRSRVTKLPKKILKYPLPLQESSEIRMPEDAQILSVQLQRDEICIWASASLGSTPATRTFVIVGTVHQIPPGKLYFLATVQQGSLVWHVFEAQV